MMKHSIILLAFAIAIVFAFGEETTPKSWDDVPGCYLTKNANQRIEFYCKMCEIPPPENCSNSTLWEATQNLNSDIVTELRMCGCPADVLINTVVELFKNLSVLDISHSGYYDYSGYKSDFYLDFKDHFRDTSITKMNASHNLLAELYVKFPSNVIVLDLSYNRFNFEIYSHHDPLVRLEKLEFLDLSHNRVVDVERTSFGNLPSLKVVRLEGNPMDSYQCEAFPLLKSPVTVYVPWQSINFLYLNCRNVGNVTIHFDAQEFITYNNGDIDIFCNQQSFQNLIIMSVDRIEMIETLTVHLGITLSSVEELRVKNARSTEIDFGPMKDMLNLRQLDISGNGFKRVKNSEVLQRLTRLTTLSARENQIENALELIRNLGSSTLDLDLSETYVGKINSTDFRQLQSLTKLILQNTEFEFEKSNPFEHLMDLSHLDISHNDLSNGNFTILASTLGKLETFMVSGCKVRNVSHLLTLLGDVVVLSLSQNDLSNVNNWMILSTFSHLRELWLSDCHIRNAVDVIKVLGSSVLYLDLSRNQIGKVDGSIFNNLKQLEILILRNTSLSIPSLDIFDRLDNLFHFDVSDNNMSGFNFTTLKLPKLLDLQLSGCQIKDVANIIGLFQPSSPIRIMDLSKNLIEDWDFSAYDHVQGYEWLQSVDFDNARKIDLLNISHNHLKTLNIPPKMFRFRSFDVRDNELSEIHNLTPERLPYMKYLGISGNRFSCEYLQRLECEWFGLEFIGSARNQKDENCRTFNESITETHQCFHRP